MSDDEDNYVEFGSALDPLEEETLTKKKPVALADQIVTDEKGRRRFHGAFTGGFSAGYFNTVGSQEGWTPSTFKSSRSDRFGQKNQNVTDFMDDEDLGAFGIAPQVVRATDDFALGDKREQGRKRTKPMPSDGPIPGLPVLEQIIQPVQETIGIKILQKMGWRAGQGVGPKTHRSSKKSSKKSKSKSKETIETDGAQIVDLTEDASNAKVYGCARPPTVFQQENEDTKSGGETEDDDNELEHYRNALFGPEDVDSPLCNPRENTFGLGYSGLDRNTIFSGHVDLFGPQLKSKVENKKMGISGEAFGVGAFETQDVDIYNREDMSQYDFALETADERKSRKRKETRDKEKKTQTQVDDCIEGFVKAKISLPAKKQYPPPHLPKNFEPFHHSKRKSRFASPPPAKASSSAPFDKFSAASAAKSGLGRHALTVEERQVLLDEHKEKVTTNERKNEANNEVSTQERVERLKKFTEVLQAHSKQEKGVQSKFKPFDRIPDKQERYEKYQTLCAAGFKESLKDLQPPEMTDWEREREKMEFERAAALYKPISNVMSSRFVSATSHDISHIIPEREIQKEKDPTQDPKVAAKMNLFGKLTHQTLEWHPDRLLCRRFNVPNPFPDCKYTGLRPETSFGEADTPAKKSIPVPETPKRSLFENLDFSKPPPGLLGTLQPASTPNKNGETEEDISPPGTSSISLPDSTPMDIEVIEIPLQPSKPSMDLFKEIFQDTSSEEESDKEDSDNDTSRFEQKNKLDRPSQPEPKVSSSKDSTKKGVFDNLDFAQLSFNRKTNEMNFVPSTTAKSSFEKEKEDEEDLYGPLAPVSNRPTISSALNYNVSSTKNEDNAMWVEKESRSRKSTSSKSKKKHKRKDSKSKKKKKESKKKHKKHKSKKGESESDSDSSDDCVIINRSLDNKALLEKLKSITK